MAFRDMKSILEMMIASDFLLPTRKEQKEMEPICCKPKMAIF